MVDMDTFKVIIAGSRSFDNYSYLEEKVDTLLQDKLKTHIVEIVSGCAKGADQLGEEYAKNRGLRVTQFFASWDTHGRSAGPVRNKEMGDYADAAIIFWNSFSKGSKNMADYMRRLGKQLYIFTFNELEN